MQVFTATVHDTIAATSRQAWDTLWPSPQEGYTFYQTQESARPEGFQFAYLIISTEHTVVLIAPLFLTALDPKLIFSGIARKLVVHIQNVWPSFLRLSALFCGSLTAEKGVIAIHPDYKANANLFETLDRALLAYAKKCGAALIYCKDLIEVDLASLAPLTQRGFTQFDAYPMTVLPITFPSLESYLSSLGSGKGADLRYKLREVAKRGGVEVSVVRSVADCIDEVYALYESTYAKGAEHFEHQPKDFFLAVSQYMPDETYFFLYRVDHRLVGFTLCLNYGDTLMNKYVGFDYSVVRRYNLYFFSFLTNIQWCIDNAKKEFTAGAGTYAAKKKFGMHTVPLFMLVKFTNPVVNRLVSPLIPTLRRGAGDPKNQPDSQ